MVEEAIDVTPEPGPGRFSRFFVRLREFFRALGRSVLKWTVRVVMAIVLTFLGAWGTQHYRFEWFGFVPACTPETKAIPAPTTTVDPDALAQAIAKKMPPPAPPIVDVDQLAEKIADKLPPFPMSREEWGRFGAKLGTIEQSIEELPKKLPPAETAAASEHASPRGGGTTTSICEPSCKEEVAQLEEAIRAKETSSRSLTASERVATCEEYCPALKPCSPFDSASKVRACLNDLKEVGEHYEALSQRAQALHKEGKKAIDVKPY